MRLQRYSRQAQAQYRFSTAQAKAAEKRDNFDLTLAYLDFALLSALGLICEYCDAMYIFRLIQRKLIYFFRFRGELSNEAQCTYST